MDNVYSKYSYDGPVKEFDQIIENRWIASTFALSEKKARSNLVFQFKKKFNRAPNAKITLAGEIKLVRKKGRES